MAVLDHVSLGVTDLARAIAFYDAVLAPLGVVRVWTAGDAAGYGYPGQDDSLAIKREPGAAVGSSARSHLAFTAPTPEAASQFHAAGIAHGAHDEGEPGFCPEYGPGYFAAFLRDHDGYRLEAVCHGAPVVL
jgi:catechol 2,3-dioxygenase-like lactoylglutathione lyase family enzyme